MYEDLMAIGFLLIGLGFFIFVIWLVTHLANVDRTFEANRDDVLYSRRLTEAREFGYDPVRLNPPDPLKKTKPSKEKRS